MLADAVCSCRGRSGDRPYGYGEQCSSVLFAVAAGDREIAPTVMASNARRCCLRWPRAIGRSPLRLWRAMLADAVCGGRGRSGDRPYGYGEQCLPVRFADDAGDREIAPTGGEQSIPVRSPRQTDCFLFLFPVVSSGEQCSPLRFTDAAGDREIAPTGGEQSIPVRSPEQTDCFLFLFPVASCGEQCSALRALGQTVCSLFPQVASNTRRYGLPGAASRPRRMMK